MNTKVWYSPYFEGVYHTQMIETFSNANARMVHTMYIRNNGVNVGGIIKGSSRFEFVP